MNEIFCENTERREGNEIERMKVAVFILLDLHRSHTIVSTNSIVVVDAVLGAVLGSIRYNKHNWMLR